ncbi:MAG: hypothetical protein ACYCXW_18890 [Solirubrobacteraceae bacterium]
MSVVIRTERRELKLALVSLPDSLLAALISGLEQHGHQLTPRYLFARREHAGCVVGAMMREYDPERFAAPSWLRFWIHHRGRGRASAYGGPFASPAVASLENLFDRAVAAAHDLGRGLGRREAARQVGAWILSEAEAELSRRHDRPHRAIVPRAADAGPATAVPR